VLAFFGMFLTGFAVIPDYKEMITDWKPTRTLSEMIVGEGVGIMCIGMF